jgi:microcystin-dependent protein
MAISQNTALFSLLGTNYGGDGKSNFGLPNLQGSVPVHAGQGPGLSPYYQGQSGGSQDVTLLIGEIPAHTHSINCVDGNRISGEVGIPTNATLSRAAGNSPPNAYLPGNSTNSQLNASVVSIAGGNGPHNNMMPILTLNFCIALQGVYPSRG